MTAEERMAYFQGEKRRTSIGNMQVKEKNWNLIFLKIKFFAAVIIFIVFLSLDYTGYKFHGIGSEEILKEVSSDFDLSKIEKLAL